MLRYAQSNVNAHRLQTDRSWRAWAATKRDSLLLEAKLRLAPLYLWLASWQRPHAPAPAPLAAK